MKVILTKAVKKWLDKQVDIDDDKLLEAANEIMDGRCEANLGGNLYKKRISTDKGKSGGARTIVAYCDGSHMFFLYAFKKNEKENVKRDELKAIKLRAQFYLSLNEYDLTITINDKKLYVIGDNDE